MNFLSRLKRLDMDIYDDRKSFMRDLWSILALYDFITGEYECDSFVEVINEI